MEITKEAESKIAQLQLIEQNLTNLLNQKQNFQAQQIEINNALEELKKTQGKTYKIIGQVMVASDKDLLKKELESKKEIVELRIKKIEEQESQIREKAKKIQEEVMNHIKESEKEKKE